MQQPVHNQHHDTAKIVARIVWKMLERKTEDVFVEDQFGCRRRKGTRNAGGMLRIISEWKWDTDEELCNFLKHSQKEAYYFCIRLFNSLSLYINKAANNAKQFRLALSIFLYSRSFYTLDKYFNQGIYWRYLLLCCNNFFYCLHML